MEKQAQKYTSEDGLEILRYLGITNLTDKEKQTFRDKWSDFYGPYNSLTMSIWKLYAEALPFICGDGNRNSFVVAQLRDSDFGKRLEQSGLDEELEEGKSLQEILQKGPHVFIKQIKRK